MAMCFCPVCWRHCSAAIPVCHKEDFLPPFTISKVVEVGDLNESSPNSEEVTYLQL